MEVNQKGRWRKEEREQIEDEKKEEMVTQLLSRKASWRKSRKRELKRHRKGG